MEKGRTPSLRLKSKDLNQHIIDNLGKLPPQALDIEEGVLGAALMERAAQLSALERLTPDDFYLETHKEVFTAITALADNGDPIDMRTVVAKLKKTGKLELVGGMYIIAELTSKVTSQIAENIPFYCGILIEHRIKRDVIQLAADLQYRAYLDESDAFSLMDDVAKFPDAVLNSLKTTTERHIKEGINDLVKRINARTADAPEIIGVASGYLRLDRLTRGFRPGNLIIIAARPSMGKTTLMLNILRNAAVDFKTPVAVFSLEMSFDEFVEKLVSAETDIDNRTLTSKVFSPVDWTRLSNQTGQLANAQIYVDDPASLTISEFRIRARRLKEKYGVGLIAVDYLQLMSGDKQSKGNREQEIASISRALKATAKELQIPIIALSQLSREVDKRPNKMPVLSDLRESGAIEQDADIIMFLFRPGYYKITGDDGGTYVTGLTKLIIAKHRNGSVGEVNVAMEGGTSKFRSVDSPYLQSGDSAKDFRPASEEPTPASNFLNQQDDDTPF